MIKLRLESGAKTTAALTSELNDKNESLLKFKKDIDNEYAYAERLFAHAMKKNTIKSPLINFHMSAASMFSGDVYISAQKPNGNIVILIGDVTGHGLTSAISSLSIYPLFTRMVNEGASIEETIKMMNSTLRQILPVNIMLAANIIEFSPDNRELIVWAAGLPPMLLLDIKTKEVTAIKANNLALSVLPSDKLTLDFQQLKTSENMKLYIFTDGLTEAYNSENEMFGEDNIIKSIKKATSSPYEEILNDVNKFTQDVHQDDDITLLEINLC